MTATPATPERTAGDRYTAIRAMLAKHAPLTMENYLAAQTVFLLMDLLAEQQATTAAQEETADLLREFIVHGKR